MIIGIYGGSFDPVHSGHAMVANFIAQCGIVDKVWMMVNKRNPLKSNKTTAPDINRLEMVRKVAEICNNVEVTDIELDLPSPSYTYDTLCELKKRYPDHTFRIIIGSDSYYSLDKWRNHDKIVKEFGLIVYPRPGYPLSETEPANVTFLTGAPEFGISSSLIREYVMSGWNINFFVPVEIADYITFHKLYLNGQ